MPTGAVSAGHELTASVAEDVLREGGNAFDALVAGFFAACVTEPLLASVGGGGFVLARPRQARIRVMDCFAMTPAVRPDRADLDISEVDVDFGDATQTFHIGNGTNAVPGAVRGMFDLHRDLGFMPMRDVMAPAIKLAVDGVRVNENQATIARAVEPLLTARASARTLYTNDERVMGEGDVWTNSLLADLFDSLSVEGADLFYRGEIARRIDDLRVSRGGAISATDLARYEVKLREPLIRDFRGTRIITTPPPSAGGMMVAFGLGVLDVMPERLEQMGDVQRARTLVDVMRATDAARLNAMAQGDELPDIARLLDPESLALWRDEVAERSAAWRGTTHINVVDGQGNMAAMSTSNGEGSGEVLLGTGFMLNNMLGEEDLNPNGVGRWTPGTRMTSMMMPTCLETHDGRTILMGSGGSNRIRTAILQVIVNLVDLGMPLEEAVYAPRCHFDDDHLYIEAGYHEKVELGLVEEFKNHTVFADRNFFFGGVHAIETGPFGVTGAGDVRRGGAFRALAL